MRDINEEMEAKYQKLKENSQMIIRQLIKQAQDRELRIMNAAKAYVK